MSTTALLTTLQFAGVNALFALAIYASLWTGVLSLAPVFFGAVSAFTFGYVAGTLGLSPALALVVGLVLGAALGAVTAALIIRLDSHYLAMATIAMVLIGRVLIINLVEYTGGPSGTLVPGELGTWLWLIGSLVVAGYVMSRLSGSRFGLAADAVREDPAVAQTLAISPRRIQFVGFVISGALGGTAGVFQASFLQYIGPDTFYTHLGFVTLAAVVLGGAFHWAGPIVGAIVFTILPELLREPMGEYDRVVTGVALILIIIYMPRGLVDVRRLRLLRTRGRRRTPADEDPSRTGSTPATVEVAP
ncbi:branched-chain amino acid ABC transporter permease [Nocardioides hwasunensis]|uniref:Branched-chain amino acid ABC transporter permease n=1 Tax=Nocardioides hwasunensis TaxID=397258 RepID=A0ABR8MHT6_9ACTN|nr:branched-chain amino acid ABC transporter permease [Nocardioides hwasunensis]MBD3915627.1 branched-chain amino acid ABC transporter permease [Nocardioides hwasunensis]